MNIKQFIRPNIIALKPYSSAREEFTGKAEVYLDANENPFQNGYNRYPDPYQKELKQKIAAIKKVSPEHIFLGNGSDEAIDLLIRIFCEPAKDQILILPPTYGMYQVSAAINNVECIKVPLSTDFQLDVDGILKKSTEKTKILFICSPNNPTGNCFEEADIFHLMENFKGIVVIDEAYSDFAQTESWSQKIQDYPNLVVLQTFSKAWGLAGIRLGMAFTNPTILHYLNKVKPPYNINQLSQEKALENLNNEFQFHLELIGIKKERERLLKQLSQLDLVEKIFPSDANFILAKVKNPDQIYDVLLQKGIIVRNRSTVYGCEGCLRFTVGTPKENETLIQALQNITSTIVA